MDLETFAKKAGPWVPLLIAAGYFVFLITMWQAFVNEQSIRRTKFDDVLDQLNKLTAPETEQHSAETDE